MERPFELDVRCQLAYVRSGGLNARLRRRSFLSFSGALPASLAQP